MSWHHGDYIDLFSAIGGVASAAFAAYATWQAKKSTEISRQSTELSRQAILESNRQADSAQLRDELIRLSERCNSTIGEDSLVKRSYAALIEIATALTIARVALIGSNLEASDKENLTALFIRNLRPGIRFEIAQFDALISVKGAFSNDILRQQYRDAQDFLSVENSRHIPDPVEVST